MRIKRKNRKILSKKNNWKVKKGLYDSRHSILKVNVFILKNWKQWERTSKERLLCIFFNNPISFTKGVEYFELFILGSRNYITHHKKIVLKKKTNFERYFGFFQSEKKWFQMLCYSIIFLCNKVNVIYKEWDYSQIYKQWGNIQEKIFKLWR